MIADAPATGHALGQLDAATAIHGLVPVGPLRSQTSWMLEIFRDPAQSGLVAVTTPEELPIAETIALTQRTSAANSVPLAAVVLNRLPELRFTTTQHELVSRLAHSSLGNTVDEDLLSASALAYALRAASENSIRSEHAAAQVTLLHEALDAKVAIVRVADIAHRARRDETFTENLISAVKGGLTTARRRRSRAGTGST